jgi:formylglycine-generating enzyme required for sulfatase activity
MELVAVEAGWFWMGRDDGGPAERPRHRVWLDAFAIAPTPVTRAEYGAFLGTTGRVPPPAWNDPRFTDPRQPAVAVSWDDAVAFCQWRAGATGLPCRLPTEAEWEKAARGGLDGARFPWGDAPPVAVFPGVAPPLAAPPPVGSGPPNGFGLTDLSGVVHEWCLDFYANDSCAVAPQRNPVGPAGGTLGVSRGGAWRHQDPWSPVAHRSSLPPHLRYTDYGFRVAASPVGSPSSWPAQASRGSRG